MIHFQKTEEFLDHVEWPSVTRMFDFDAMQAKDARKTLLMPVLRSSKL